MAEINIKIEPLISKQPIEIGMTLPGPQGIQGIQGPPVPIANNLITTVAGTALDATQGKLINDNLTTHKAETASKHITESGSNANGSYIKFDDGTMICTCPKTLTGMAITTAIGQIFRSATISYTFPAAFIAPPSYSPPIPAIATNLWALGNFNSMTSCAIYIASATSHTPAEISAPIIAIGRWKV